MSGKRLNIEYTCEHIYIYSGPFLCDDLIQYNVKFHSSSIFDIT